MMKFTTSSQKILQQESDNLPRRTQHLCSSFLLYKIVCACAHESTRTLLALVSGGGAGEEAWLLSVAPDFAAALPPTPGRCLQMHILVLHFWDDFLVALPSGHKYPGLVTEHTCVPEFPVMRPQLPFAPPRRAPPSSPQIVSSLPTVPTRTRALFHTFRIRDKGRWPTSPIASQRLLCRQSWTLL